MTPLYEMRDEARIWIYQSNRFLTQEEVAIIKQQGKEFVTQWQSHGAAMDASIDVLHNRLIILAADEDQAMASGCGIDESVQFIKKLGQQLHLDFFQRTQVLFRSEQDELNEKPLHEFWAMRKAGIINDNTRILDNTIKTVGQLKSAWEKPFIESWHQEMWAR